MVGGEWGLVRGWGIVGQGEGPQQTSVCISKRSDFLLTERFAQVRERAPIQVLDWCRKFGFPTLKIYRQ